MDTYQKVMVKLLEVTEGRDSKAVDFKDLVKKLGYHGHYASIFSFLNEQGWIAEGSKADFVRITHWGVAEAKKALAGHSVGGTTSTAFSENAASCAATAKEFATLLQNFAKDASKENLKKAENKFAELEAAFNLAKKDAQ